MLLRAGLPIAVLLLAADAWAQDAPRFAVPGALRTLPGRSEDQARGVPVRLSAVLSSWKLQPLLQHFADAFLEAGLYLPPISSQPRHLREPQLTALDVDRNVSYTVIFQPHSDGTTTVIYGEAGLDRRSAADVGLPVFPEARGLIQTRGEAGRILSYVAVGTAAEVADYYGATLPAAGWSRQRDGTWARPGAQLQLKIEAHPQGAVVRLLELPPSEPESVGVGR
jgi:hypothetical protein